MCDHARSEAAWMSRQRSEVQRSRGPEVQRSRGPEVQRSRGPEVQRFRGPEVQRLRGSEAQRLRGSERASPNRTTERQKLLKDRSGKRQRYLSRIFS